MTNDAQIRGLLGVSPFREFHLAMSDGRSFAITNPELLMLEEDGRCVHLYDFPGMSETLDLAHIVSVRFYEPGIPEQAWEPGQPR